MLLSETDVTKQAKLIAMCFSVFLCISETVRINHLLQIDEILQQIEHSLHPTMKKPQN